LLPTPSPTLRTGATYDVIVVGARAAGAATAMLLARAGLRTLLLDDRPIVSDALCAHALTRGAVLQLSRWGLLEAVVAAGTPPVRRTTYHYSDDTVVISVKPAHGVDALYAPPRSVLDPMLVDAARHAGAHVHHRTSVNGPILRDGRVVGVRATTEDRRFVDLCARLVVGADGVRSTVARRVGSTTTRQGAHAGAMTYAYWSDLDIDGYEWTFRANATSGLIPTTEGRVGVFASASPERIGRGGVGVIRDIVGASDPQLAKRLKTTSIPRSSRTWTGHRGYLRRCWGPGWALVGDAGGFTDPVGLRGVTDALRDAELLVRAVVDGFRDHTALGDALDHYQTTRDRIAVPLFDVIDRIASHQWDDEEIGSLQLRLSSATVGELETLAALETEAS
jgi:flavin-dependent dehydrogenase